MHFSQSRFGGRIFLSTNGHYNPSSSSLNLQGMKIYNNSADKYGQRQYIKGNYSDLSSNKGDLVGVQMLSQDFSTSEQSLIIQDQRNLEFWWKNPHLQIWHVQNGDQQTPGFVGYD
ncbi:MAG: hypothetical protein EZS28_014000 [Streblomastix strix]|uniref:Uncharacterized protein n=1 Tax=Streblomastix strix TaxID=222440 RepID=A0A5J4W7N5_9EUKA|nr:MAG: hypothetical protein EZS28_014000 [Streblomastix strix]